MLNSPRIFYGWWLVLVCLLIQGITAGVTIYLYSIVAGEVEREFSASRAVVMMGLTGHGIAVGLLAPKLGDLMDRFSIKWTVIGTALLMSSGFVAMSFSPSVWGFVGSYTLLIPAGSATLSMLFTSLLLSRWFARHRGLAIGIAALGTQLGGFTCPPLVAMLIDAFDWRFAMRAVGLFVAVVIPLLAYWTVVDRPSDRGLSPDGDPQQRDAPPATASPATAAGIASLKIVLNDRNFWLMAFGITAMIAMFVAVLANLTLFATDIGTPREQAALLVSLYAIVGMIFSVVIGRTCDVLDVRLVFAGLLASSILAMVCFLIADSYFGLLVATGIVAIPGGGFMPLWGAMIGRLFDLRLYGRVMGSMTLFSVLGSAASPVLSGWLFDATGSYRTLFIALIVLLAIPLLCTPLIRKPGRR